MIMVMVLVGMLVYLEKLSEAFDFISAKGRWVFGVTMKCLTGPRNPVLVSKMPILKSKNI